MMAKTSDSENNDVIIKKPVKNNLSLPKIVGPPLRKRKLWLKCLKNKLPLSVEKNNLRSDETEEGEVDELEEERPKISVNDDFSTEESSEHDKWKSLTAAKKRTKPKFDVYYFPSESSSDSDGTVVRKNLYSSKHVYRRNLITDVSLYAGRKRFESERSFEKVIKKQARLNNRKYFTRESPGEKLKIDKINEWKLRKEKIAKSKWKTFKYGNQKNFNLSEKDLIVLGVRSKKNDEEKSPTKSTGSLQESERERENAPPQSSEPLRDKNNGSRSNSAPKPRANISADDKNRDNKRNASANQSIPISADGKHKTSHKPGTTTPFIDKKIGSRSNLAPKPSVNISAGDKNKDTNSRNASEKSSYLISGDDSDIDSKKTASHKPRAPFSGKMNGSRSNAATKARASLFSVDSKKNASVQPSISISAGDKDTDSRKNASAKPSTPVSAVDKDNDSKSNASPKPSKPFSDKQDSRSYSAPVSTISACDQKNESKRNASSKTSTFIATPGTSFGTRDKNDNKRNEYAKPSTSISTGDTNDNRSSFRDRRTVISGSYHQGNEIFPVDCRGKQCTANSLMAVVHNKTKDASRWGRQDINSILSEGNKLYQTLVKSSSITDDYLLVSELPTELEIDGINYFFVYGEPYAGLLFTGQNDSAISEGCYDLETALRKAFKKHKSVFINFGFNTMSVVCEHNVYYYFDSHSRSESDGLQVSDGKAVVVKLESIADLHMHLILLANSMGLTRKTQFEVTSFSAFQQD